MAHFQREKSKGTLVLVGIGLSILLTGCPPSPQISRPSAPSPPSMVAYHVLEKLHQQEQAITTLSGLFRAELRGFVGAFAPHIEGVVFYHRPQRMRLRGFTRIGGTLFDAVLSPVQYLIFLPQEGKVYTGSLGSWGEHAAGFEVPLRLSIRAMEILLGNIATPAERLLDFKEEAEHYRFDYADVHKSGTSSSLTHRVWVDRRYLRVSRVEYFSPSGDPMLVVTADHFRRVQDAASVEQATIMLPFSVEAIDPLQNGAVSLTFVELTVNTPLDQAVFHVKTPWGGGAPHDRESR
ncbi:MAG: hypothetical protein D6704_07435 [Nitrospirae bacterium]|nr:MAG: hypothetical protein D6704_07435 [Nitrospirota bacterium]